MKQLLFVAAAVTVMAACNNANNQSNNADSIAMSSDSTTANIGNTSNAATDTGWTSLFDGKTLSGWHSYGKTAAGSDWSVDSNTIHLKPTNNAGGGGDLLTN